MSANNYMLIHKLGDSYCIWDNLNAEEAAENEPLGMDNVTNCFPTLEDAIEWANKNDQTEYGYQVNNLHKPKDGFLEKIVNHQEKIAVIGHTGVVGNAVYQAFRNKFFNDVVGLSSETGSYQEVAQADFVFLCVPTPESKTGEVDMSIVYSVMDNLKNNKIKDQIIIIKSTVEVGTNQALSEKYPEFIFVSSPEFLTEKNAEFDFLHPDRIVIGSESLEASSKVASIYNKVIPDTNYFYCSPIEAELIKYFSNVFLALKIIFSNEANKICRKYSNDSVRADWNSFVRFGFGLDKRIGMSHTEVTKKGGFGGMCFPKDTKGLYYKLLRDGYDSQLLKLIIDMNNEFRKNEKEEKI
jgi:UDPglucose 6-dehydrogenase